jgi:hypothetical protein
MRAAMRIGALRVRVGTNPDDGADYVTGDLRHAAQWLLANRAEQA